MENKSIQRIKSELRSISHAIDPHAVGHSPPRMPLGKQTELGRLGPNFLESLIICPPTLRVLENNLGADPQTSVLSGDAETTFMFKNWTAKYHFENLSFRWKKWSYFPNTQLFVGLSTGRGTQTDLDELGVQLGARTERTAVRMSKGQ